MSHHMMNVRSYDECHKQCHKQGVPCQPSPRSYPSVGSRFRFLDRLFYHSGTFLIDNTSRLYTIVRERQRARAGETERVDEVTYGTKRAFPPCEIMHCPSL
jgi:hypothetical protein